MGTPLLFPLRPLPYTPRKRLRLCVLYGFSFSSPAASQNPCGYEGAEEGSGIDRGIRQIGGQEAELPENGEKG
ncbi:hypothetical protein AGMMS4952_01660 [Spirochaetia bacterium]|nr:hypothetical protein AGMMS4952_01660 [Spirochaetia bacterium]